MQFLIESLKTDLYFKYIFPDIHVAWVYLTNIVLGMDMLRRRYKEDKGLHILYGQISAPKFNQFVNSI